MEDRKKADLDRMFLEVEILLEKESEEKELDLENICDLSVILRKLAYKISTVSSRKVYGISVKKDELLRVSELYYDRSKKIKDYINLTLMKKIIDIKTENLKEEILKVKSIENLTDFVDMLDNNVLTKEKIEILCERYMKMP